MAWDDATRVLFTATKVPPDGDRRIKPVMDVGCGEYLEVREDAEGFAHAVQELCRLSGPAVPHRAASAVADVNIWLSNPHAGASPDILRPVAQVGAMMTSMLAVLGPEVLAAPTLSAASRTP